MVENRFNMQSSPAAGAEAGKTVECGTCPLCRTVTTRAIDATLPDATWWRCTGCGQVWSAGRLLVVAAYADYVAHGLVTAAR